MPLINAEQKLLRLGRQVQVVLADALEQGICSAIAQSSVVVLETALLELMVAMKAKIDRLQGLNLVLFLGSLAILATSWVVHLPLIFHLVWALTLGGSIICRVQRQSLVTKYNAMIYGGHAPIA